MALQPCKKHALKSRHFSRNGAVNVIHTKGNETKVLLLYAKISCRCTRDLTMRPETLLPGQYQENNSVITQIMIFFKVTTQEIKPKNCLMGLHGMRELLYSKHSNEKTLQTEEMFPSQTSPKGLTLRAYELKNIQLQKVPKHLYQ